MGFNAKNLLAFSLAALIPLSSAQNVTVPDTCTAGFEAGTDTVIFTTPYTYAQVMSIIGSYQNLTWSGNPPDTVTLNGTDNTVGTARTYDTAGAHVIETILIYSKPPNGPYDEVHNTALLTVPAAGNLSLYIPYDGTTVTSICGGKASTFNFTANFCASNATTAAAVLHMLHLHDAETVGVELGGANFTTCAAISGLPPGNGTGGAVPTGTGAPTPSVSLMPFNPNGAGVLGASVGFVGVLAGLAALAVGL